jgi:hypothetical protein
LCRPLTHNRRRHDAGGPSSTEAFPCPRKKSLSIGINYVGTPYALGGCINDADDWASLLGRHGFQSAVLPEKQATRANIMSGIASPGRRAEGRRRRPPSPTPATAPGCPTRTATSRTGGTRPWCRRRRRRRHGLIVDDELHLSSRRSRPAPTSCSSPTRATPGRCSGSRRSARPPSASGSCRRSRSPSRPSSSDTVERVHRQPAAPRSSDAPLPGLVHFSACKDTEYANDISVAGRGCGAFSHFAVPAFADALVARQDLRGRLAQDPQLPAQPAVPADPAHQRAGAVEAVQGVRWRVESDHDH